MSDLALLLQAFEVVARTGIRLAKLGNEINLTGTLSDEKRAELTAMTEQIEDGWFNGSFQGKAK